MSKYLAAFLVVGGVVSGQYYGGTTAPTDTSTSTVLVPSTTTSTSTLTDAPESSITNTSASSYTTETFYYCTTPTFSAIGPFVTIFNTVYFDVCPTGGLTQVTYTITDTCGCQHETDYIRPTGCPSGFTVTEKTCSMCPGSSVITCTTPIAPATGTTNPTTAPAGSTQGSNPQYPQNPQSTQSPQYSQSSQSGQNPQYSQNQQSAQNSQYTKPGSTPSTVPGTKPSYLSTSNAKPAAGSSPLGIIMFTSMAVVAGLMCIL